MGVYNVTLAGPDGVSSDMTVWIDDQGEDYYPHWRSDHGTIVAELFGDIEEQRRGVRT